MRMEAPSPVRWPLERLGTRSLVRSWIAGQTHSGAHRTAFHELQMHRLRHLELSAQKEIVSKHSGCNIHVLSLDSVEERFLLTGSYNGAIALYDLHKSRRKNSTEIFRPVDMAGISGPMISAIHWYPVDCGVFVASDMGGSVVLFDTATLGAAAHTTFPGYKVSSVRFHPQIGSLSLVAAAVSDGTIRLWDILQGHSTHTLHCHSDAVTSVDWHPFNEHQLLSSSVDGCVRLWDIRKAGASSPILSLDWRRDHAFAAEKWRDPLSPTGAPSAPRYHHSIPGSKASQLQGSSLSRAHDGPVMSARFTATASHILSAGNDHKLRLWSGDTGQPIHTNYDVNCHNKLGFRLEVAQLGPRKEHVLFMPDNVPTMSNKGQQIAGMTGRIAVLPLLSGTGEALKLLKGHLADVEAVVYRSSTQQVISTAKDKLILLWEAAQADDWDDSEEFYDHAREKRKQGTVPPAVRAAPEAKSSRQSRLSTWGRRLAQQTSGVVEYKDADQNVEQKAPEERQPSRLFVPPIIRQYMEEAQRARKRGAEEREVDNAEEVAQPKPTRSSKIDWGNVEALFASFRDMER